MKIYDISRGLFTAEVYPGDPKPELERIHRIETGSAFNLSAFFMCCHNATHVDAPLHFVADGKSIAEIPLSRFTGYCTVVRASGILTGSHMDEILPYCEKMILFHGEGEAYLTVSAAFALADAGITLVGTDAQSIAPPSSMAETHRELLSRELIVLEGLDLSEVPDGRYLLFAFPLKLGAVEGAPVRAVLLSEEE